MNRQIFEAIIKESLDRRLTLSAKKGADYATEDVLSNFKRMADAVKILRIDPTTPYGIALVYAMLKIDRLCNLLSKGTKPQNEALRDTVDDLKTYMDLLEACLYEEAVL